MDEIKCCWYKDFPDECCSNGNSIYFGDWVDLEDTCEDWEELPPEPACICKCVANRGGHCVSMNCRGPITALDIRFPASDEEAAKRYDLFADFFEEMF